MHGLFLLCLLATVAGVYPQTPILFRISTENPPAHVQARALHAFADLLAGRAGPSLRVEYYDAASLYRDANALGAIARGELEMAAPGIWQFDRVVPDTAAMMLPAMYARPRDWVRSIVDGDLGKVLSAKIEESMKAIVIGAWLDLGYGQLFSARDRIQSIADIRGKRIRVAGGQGNEERIRALGGIPVSIPLLDLPAYIEQNLVDGVLSTYETVFSAGLDVKGLRTALEDREYYAFYVPLVSRRAWDRLDETQRTIITATWVEIVLQFREEASMAQEQARLTLLKRGMAVHIPTDRELAATRTLLLAGQKDMGERLNISAHTMELLELLERLNGQVK